MPASLETNCNGASTTSAQGAFDPRRKLVRINGERNGLIEFDFAIGDMDLAVEMLLPPEEFRRFCEANTIALVTDPRATPKDDALLAMSWRPSDVQHEIEKHIGQAGDQ